MLAIRREVVDYGAIPLSSWLPHGDSTVAIQTWLRQCSDIAREDGTHRENTTYRSLLEVRACFNIQGMATAA